jgi:YegS/Rv2252/BmrU family lipid kinase
MAERYFVILNPACGRGAGRRLLPQIKNTLDRERLEYTLQLTDKPLEASLFAREAAEKFSVVVAAGGDGTVNEVANGLMGSGVAMGVLPIGSGNDFAKCLHLTPDLTMAVRTLKDARRRHVDIARLGARYFANGLGIGLDGAASHRNRAIKYLRGKVAYLWAAICEALQYHALPLQLKTPHWEYSGQFLMAGASNGHCHGGDFLLAPNAQIDDGLLDIHLITDMRPVRRLLQIPKVKKGQHLSLPEVHMHQAPWVELSSPHRLLAHLDGEPFVLEPGVTRVELIPRGLAVISA